MQSIRLPRTLVNKILAQAQAKDQQEICGLISRNTLNELAIFPVSNIASDPCCFFEMDPSETIQAMKEIRHNGAELFAIYHSHPSTAAFPSATDIEKIAYPDAIYLIVSLNTTGVLELKGYKIQDDTAQPIDLIL
ncbi:MAG: M67 family metallopeptidase [Gammaproteobacteria bacterium]|nr:M67 family metallopeptidase [Gammaproteobacteria bacterium]